MIGSYRELIEKAAKIRECAYAPYSNFAVGAALLSHSGDIFCGVNVENASYGLTICAERAALFRAVAEGHRSFQAIAIVADTPGFVSPCGACRQVLAEFGLELPVIMARPDGSHQIKTISDLLPGVFTLAGGG